MAGKTIGTAGTPDRDSAPGGTGALLYHGGNLAVARSLWPLAPEPWIDLSTGINPVPYPLPDLPAEAWTRLPEPAEVRALEETAAAAWGADPGSVVAAPGTQALLQVLPRIVPAGNAALLGFTYAEHARTWAEIGGARVVTVEKLDDLAAADVAVVVNPNNPDGRLVPADDLARLAREMAARNRLLVVDEAFADVLPAAASVASRAAECGAVVLRSFGKTYGLAGVRLGFLIGPLSLAKTVRDALGPWAVSGPAVAAGRVALADRAWLASTVERLHADAARLDGMLAEWGMVPAGGTPLFRLATASDAQERFRRLGASGILVRAFSAHPDRLRFGLPAPAQWRVLEERFSRR